MDVSFLEKYNIAALVMLSQAGMEGGNALADVLSGAVTPSGKLTDTWGCRYEDYPSSATFSHNNGNIIEEKYYEGIYVGYRYFDSFEVEPRYPFGYGMSYTTFDVATENAAWKPDAEPKTITVTVKVTNTGSCAGKEVVQIYAACPFGKLKKRENVWSLLEKQHCCSRENPRHCTLRYQLSCWNPTGQAKPYTVWRPETMIFWSEPQAGM